MSEYADHSTDDDFDEMAEPTFGLRCLLAIHYVIDLLVGVVALFPFEWLFTRNWISLLAGLPALIVLAAAAGLYLRGAMTSRETTISSYRREAFIALWERDIETADVYYRRVMQLDPDDSASLYGLAMAAEQQGRRNRARSLMQRIAPPDEPGNSSAHFWLALDQVNHEGIPSDPAAAEVLEHHLLQATSRERYRKETRFWLAELYIQRGQVDQAISQLETLVLDRPELLLKLAQLYRQRGDVEKCKTAASRAAAYHQSRVDAEPECVEHRLLWAWSVMLQGRYSEAEEILTSTPNAADSPQIHEALVAVYLQWFRAVYVEEPDNLIQQLELLNRALAVDPNEPQVLAFLADLATWEWEGAGDAEAALRQAVVQGVAPGVVHLILGTRMLQKGDIDGARMHLEIAHDRNLDAPLLLNNLAWSLAFQEDPELDRALELAFAARELSDHPEIDETLGTILAKAGRLQEAVQRLEKALRGLPNRPEIHGKLARLYERLGDEQLAKLHQQLSEI